MRRWLCATALLLLHGQVAAHPHAWVDQQAIVSLDRHRVVIEYRVVPSFRDGTHMFDHLDRNHDGVMSEAEKRAYAAALIRSTRMMLDGQRVALRPAEISIPPRSSMSGGRGLLAVKATAPLLMGPDQGHLITMHVGYALFKKGWFLQPFYGRTLTLFKEPSLRRTPGSHEITVEVPRANQRRSAHREALSAEGIGWRSGQGRGASSPAHASQQARSATPCPRPR